MNRTAHYELDDLALFAMQLLPKDEAAAVASHVEECAVCRRELAEIHGDLAAYALTTEMHSPPAQTRDRFLKEITREKKVGPSSVAQAATESAQPPAEYVARAAGPARGRQGAPQQGYGLGLGQNRYLEEEEAPPKKNRLANVFAWVGWAAAAGIAVYAGNLYRERETMHTEMMSQATKIDRLSADASSAKQLMDTMTDPKAQRVMLMKSPAEEMPQPQPQGRVTYVSSTGTLVFLANSLEPLGPYKTYELWLMPADGRDPIPAGTFHPDERGNASVIMPPMPKGIDAKSFGVTVEDQGGSQTPTMPIVLAGS